MDTETVLQIINMLDNRLKTIDKDLTKYISGTPMGHAEQITVLTISYNELKRFKDYLQDSIELQVAHIED